MTERSDFPKIMQELPFSTNFLNNKNELFLGVEWYVCLEMAGANVAAASEEGATGPPTQDNMSLR